MELTEEKLLDQLLAGNREATRLVVTEYSGVMLSVARAMVGSNNAEDTVQEAWISAFKALPKFERRASLKTWLVRITINQAKTQLRKPRPEVSQEDLGSPLDMESRFDERGHWQTPLSEWETNSPEEALQALALQDCLDKHIDELPENQRMTLIMRDMQGMDTEDICNILDISPSNIRVLLHRGRLQILQMVERFQETGEC